MTVWRMRIACWITNAAKTHSDYVILLIDCNNRKRKFLFMVPVIVTLY